MKKYTIKYRGTGAVRFIKGETNFEANTEQEARVWFKKLYPSAVIVNVEEVK